MTLAAVPRMNAVSPLVQDEQARVRATLAKVRVFQDLPGNALDDLAARVQIRRALGGAAIVNQDEPGDALYLIMAGRVKIVVFGEGGREVTLSVLRPTDIFGEMSLFDGEK